MPEASTGMKPSGGSISVSGQGKLDGDDLANMASEKIDENEVARKLRGERRREVIDQIRSKGDVGLDLLQREQLYESAYELCNEFLNGIYGSSVVADANQPEALPLECVEIKDLLLSALGQARQLEEKVLLIEILARWEPTERQLEFIRKHAGVEPIISGAELAMLERNALYHANSVAEKQSVIETFADLPSEARPDHAHEFFQTFSPLALEDARSGVTDYFGDLVATANLFEVPAIPSAVDQADVSSLVSSLPHFSSDQEFQLWAKENPEKYLELQSAVSSSGGEVRFAGSLSSVELGLAIRGEPPSARGVVAQLEEEVSDTKVYHALSEIGALKDQGEYYFEYYKEASNSSILRSRVGGLRLNDELSDGQRASVNQLYSLYWPDY